MHTSSIQPTKKRQFSFVTRTLRKASVVVAYYLDKIGISPTQVLFFRVIVFGGGSLYFFFSSDYVGNLIGLALIILCYFFDLVDGDLARNHDQVTELGGFLDGNFDAIVLNSIILTLTLKYSFDGYEIGLFAGIAILFATIFSSKMTEVFRNRFRVGCVQGSDRFEEYMSLHTLDRVSRFFYELITPRGLPVSLLSNFRDYLLVGILFDILPLTFLGFAIALNLRWILLFSMVGVYYHGITKQKRSIKLFELMKESDNRDTW